MCVDLKLGASPAGNSTSCEGGDREHECSKQTPACSCQPDGASRQHDVVSSDYRFVYLGCKVGNSLTTDSLKLAPHSRPDAPCIIPICVFASCSCSAVTYILMGCDTSGCDCKPSNWTAMLPSQPLFSTTDAYTHSNLVVYCCRLRQSTNVYQLAMFCGCTAMFTVEQSAWLQDTWTPFHADVLRSYSWSTNVVGRKRWKLLPPEYTHLLYDRFGR